jgi:cellulose synthase/poly-beta-1,6-N-acetylglucosamine synthase-like glycosyltransferase
MILLLELITWFFILLIFYTYIGYGVLLGILVKLRPTTHEQPPSYLPSITHLIPVYNEDLILVDKIKNSLALNYPSDKYKIIVITDGSSDQSASIADSYENIIHLHYPERRGKIGAINRALPLITSEIIVVSDANTMLNESALRHLVHPFNREDVGVVAGEKRINTRTKDKAAGSGEGLYWKYESLLKKWDGQLYSVMGAAGELFAVRRKLLIPMNEDIILEDFYISLSLAMKGFRTAYAPDAIASEEASPHISEELKRKIRISAGAFQVMWKLKSLLNIFRYGTLSFQYISHRVLRWTLAPAGLLIVFISTGILAFHQQAVFQVLFTLQIIFYLLALIGAIFHDRAVKYKVIFVPFYFSFMNYAIFAGFLRFIQGKQTSVWEKAKRQRFRDHEI